MKPAYARGLAMLASLLIAPVRLSALNRTFRPRAVTAGDLKEAVAKVKAFGKQRPRPWRTWRGFSSNGLRTRLRLERYRNQRRSNGRRSAGPQADALRPLGRGG